jgi:hypothetical protein
MEARLIIFLKMKRLMTPSLQLIIYLTINNYLSENHIDALRQEKGHRVIV